MRYHALEARRGREREPDELPAVGEEVHHPLPHPEPLVGGIDDDRGDQRVLCPVRDRARGADEPVAVPRRRELGRAPERALERGRLGRAEVPARRSAAGRRPGPVSGNRSRTTSMRSRVPSDSHEPAFELPQVVEAVGLDPAQDLGQRPRLAVAVGGLGPVVGAAERLEALHDPRPRPRQRLRDRHAVHRPLVAAGRPVAGPGARPPTRRRGAAPRPGAARRARRPSAAGRPSPRARRSGRLRRAGPRAPSPGAGSPSRPRRRRRPAGPSAAWR